MKLIALGSNLSAPVQNIRAAVENLSARGFTILARALLYVTAPVPKSDQPDFINTVLHVGFSGTASDAMLQCLAVETDMGRVRKNQNEARVIDIDIIAWDKTVSSGTPHLPHPRMHERAFVIWPLCDIAPDWQHPILPKTAAELKTALPDSGIRLSEEQW